MSDLELQVKTSPPFRLKDRVGKNFQVMNIRKQFGFVPETIIIERMIGTKDVIVVRAVLTEDEKVKEKAMIVASK